MMLREREARSSSCFLSPEARFWLIYFILVAVILVGITEIDLFVHNRAISAPIGIVGVLFVIILTVFGIFYFCDCDPEQRRLRREGGEFTRV